MKAATSESQKPLPTELPHSTQTSSHLLEKYKNSISEASYYVWLKAANRKPIPNHVVAVKLQLKWEC